ncbi:MAG: YraN family protein [Ectothiorhodospiraceae bacterium]|jgi:putative endonuclease|nr:YraN family protein [Ectothiorhodospiraceae bacterium]
MDGEGPTRRDGGRHQRGQQAEQDACAHLTGHGLRLLTTNYRCRGGEIDLVMEDGRTLVFVEVRMRRHQRFGGALESIDGHKRRRLLVAARHYLQACAKQRNARFDVVTVDGQGRLEWIRNAFEADAW